MNCFPDPLVDAPLAAMDVSMARFDLTDFEWRLIQPLLRNKPRGVARVDDRQVLNGIFWVLRTGSPWRDLPDAFGDWNSVFRRFSRWSHKGVWWRIFAAMSDDPDFEYLIVDSTIIRAHQHASGAKKGGLKIRPLAVHAVA